MAAPAPDDDGGDMQEEPDHAPGQAGRDQGMPRWVKVSGIIVGALILVVIALQFTGGVPGEHGPGRHVPADSSSEVGGGDPDRVGSEEPLEHTPPVDHGAP